MRSILAFCFILSLITSCAHQVSLQAENCSRLRLKSFQQEAHTSGDDFQEYSFKISSFGIYRFSYDVDVEKPLKAEFLESLIELEEEEREELIRSHEVGDFCGSYTHLSYKVSRDHYDIWFSFLPFFARDTVTLRFYRL